MAARTMNPGPLSGHYAASDGTRKSFSVEPGQAPDPALFDEPSLRPTLEAYGFKAPGATAPSPEPVVGGTRRYSRIPSSNPQYDAAQAAQATAESAAFQAPDLASVRARELADKRARITGIQQRYEEGIKDFDVTERAARDERSRGLRAMSASYGLGGSPTSFSQSSANANQSQQAMDRNAKVQRAAADAEVAKVYDTVDANALELYRMEKADSKEARDEVIKRVRDSAASQLKALGSTLGTQHTYDEQKAADPELFRNLADHSGLSDYEMRAMFEASVPEQYRPKSQEVTTVGKNGNAVIRRVSYDPVKGKMTTSEDYDTGIPYAEYAPDAVIKGADGVMLIPDPDKPGSYKRINPVTEKESLELQKLRQEVAKAAKGTTTGSTASTATGALAKNATLAAVGLPITVATAKGAFSRSSLSKVIQAGVEEDVANNIWENIAAGNSLEDIRQYLGQELGHDEGFGALDKFMSALQG